MLSCFTTDKTNAVPVECVTVSEYSSWISKQPAFVQSWLNATQFRAEPTAFRLIADSDNQLSRVVICVSDKNGEWDVGNLPMQLPEGIYDIKSLNKNHVIAWGMGAYQFTRYKNPKREAAKLFVTDSHAGSSSIVESIYLVRDLINTPTDDMGPSELSRAAKILAEEFGAIYTEIVGEDLLKQNYPAIHAVGRASDDAPRLIDMKWGDKNHPRITLVGKGVCFDTGGLDIKPSQYMLLMKKDMGGGAHALGLARMIMSAKLPVFLRVLIPAVENAVSGNAYRPGDVVKSRKGLTIEIGNTDAEGRVILADALTEAVNDNPDLIIDLSTLTGAARVALGTELPAVFANNDDVVDAVIKSGMKENDLMWRLPLFAPYREHLNSQIADINNNSSDSYAGAISAALFLKEFVPDAIPWLHFDMMAWNTRARPGKPIGGEAMCLRALFDYLNEKY